MVFLRVSLRLPLILCWMIGCGSLMLLTARHQTICDHITAAFCRGLLRLLGISPTVRGSPAKDPVLVVANHISWVDVIALRACLPAAFIAKSDVADWPLIGLLVARTGHCFVDRNNAFACYRTLPHVEGLLAQRSVVAFPEGTTTLGEDCGRYYPMFIEGAVRGGRPVQPVVLRYRDPSGARCQAVPFVGDDTFVASLLKIAAAPAVRLELTWLPSLLGEDRRALAERSRALTRAILDRRGELELPEADGEPLAA